MPRQKLRQAESEAEAEAIVEPEAEAEAEVEVEPEGEAEAEAVIEPEAEPEPEAEAEVEVEPEGEAEAEAEAVVEPEPEAEPVTRPSRFPWRRAKAAAPTPEPDAPEAVGSTESDSTATESEAVTSEGSDESESDESEPPSLIMVPHRTAGRRLKAAAIVAGGLFVAASAFAGATLQPYLVDRAEVQTKLDVARTAQAAITTLWTYTPEDMDKLDERAAKYLGGDFAKDYKDYIGRIVEANKQAQITNSTQVLGAAVESLTPTEASAIIYTNSVATSPVTKGIPSLRYLSYRLQLERKDGRWLITTMTAVTSLDLTPRL